MSEITVTSYRLARFVAGLASSTIELQEYLADPGPVMAANGLTDKAKVREQEGETKTYELARDHTVEIPVQVAPQGFAWFVIQTCQ